MNKFNKLILSVGLILSFCAFGNTTDYIDIKTLCEELKTSLSHIVHEENSTCLKTKKDTFKTNHTHSLIINRVNEDTEEIEKVQTDMSESDLVKLCEEFDSKKFKGGDLKVISIDMPSENKKGRWRISFTFGPFISFHNKFKIHIKNDDTDLTISELRPVQRTSHKYYEIFREGVGFLQFIDEPQNDITIEIVNDKMYFGVRYSHPKNLFQDIHDNPQINHHVGMVGTIGGHEVDEDDVNLRRYIHTISTSHGNTNINLIGGKIFNIAGNQDKNNLEFRLGGGAGVSFANGVSKYWALDENGNNNLKIKEHAGMRIYGFNITADSEVRYNFLRGKMSASLKARGVYTMIDGPIGDFHAKANLFSSQYGISVGYSPDILPSKSKREKKRIARIKKEDEDYRKEQELQLKYRTN